MEEALLKSVNISERIAEFYRSFKDPLGEYKYRKRIARMALEGSVSLMIDFDDLLSFDVDIASRLIEDPKPVLEAASEAIKEVMRVESADYASRIGEFFARIANLPDSLRVPIRGIRAIHLNKLIAVEGIVTKISPVKQQLIEAVFRCRECGEEVVVKQLGRGLERPTQCPRCASEGRKRHEFELILEKSRFIDWQKFVLQERPEELPSGQLPRSIEVIATHDLVDVVRPGDRATVTGILAVTLERRMRRDIPPIFQTYLEANNIEVSSKESIDVDITPEDEKRILELARRPDIRELLVNSIAPSIYGYRDIKRAVAALLFGGVPKIHPDGVRVRGDIHVLLIGDPGTAKSQLLRYVASIAPRGVYTSGKGSTAAGLTAAVVREKATGDFFLEAGALVLADGGVACLHPSTRVLINGREVSIEKLFDERGSVRAFSKGEVVELNYCTHGVVGVDGDLKPRPALASIVRRKIWRGYMLKISLDNGYKIILTPDHLILDYNTLTWREAGKFKVGDKVATIAWADGAESGAPCVSSASITSIEPVPYEGYVYDLYVPDLHNFVAESIVVHNCIDEFDKMDPRDRVSIHEAMEQQSYHPDTELMLADGTRIRIGELVEELFRSHPERVVMGVNCLILPVRDLGIEILTTDFNRIFPVAIDRVSKHVAPSRFIEITYSNGRSIKVTPEHPVFVKRDGKLVTVRADEVKVGDLAPAPKALPVAHRDSILVRLREAFRELGYSEDGCILFRTNSPRQAAEIQDMLLVWGIESRIRKGGSYEVVVDKDYVGRFYTLISESRAVDSYCNRREERDDSLAPIGWVRVTSVKAVPNDGVEWVYDVTVEPTRTFISNCLVLHNTVSIAKAGIVATLNARASILAAANPAFGRYLHNRPVTENIDLPPTILSRFDLIFVITDTPNAERDRELAEHVMDFHRQYYPETLENVIPRDLLKKYIAYARRHVRPKLSEEAKKRLVDFYVEMRAKSQGVDSPIAITPRQLEALIRLAEAHARMSLSDVVTEEDAEAAIELMMAFLRSVGYDVETKRIDIDIVMTGQPKSQRDKIVMVLDLLERMMRESGGEPVKREDFVERATEKGLEENFVRRVLEKLYEGGEIIEPRPGYIMLLRSR